MNQSTFKGIPGETGGYFNKSSKIEAQNHLLNNEPSLSQVIPEENGAAVGHLNLAKDRLNVAGAQGTRVIKSS